MHSSLPCGFIRKTVIDELPLFQAKQLPHPLRWRLFKKCTNRSAQFHKSKNTACLATQHHAWDGRYECDNYYNLMRISGGDARVFLLE